MKKVKTIFTTVIFAYIYLLIALLVPTNYTVTAPYRTSAVNNLIEIEGISQTENLRIVSVISYDNITPFQRMLYSLFPQFSIRELSPLENEITTSEQIRQGSISKLASYEQSIIYSFTRASELNPQVSITYEFTGLVVYYRLREYNVIEIGDIILSVNNVSSNYQDMITEFSSDNQVELVILRNDQQLDLSLTKSSDSLWQFYLKHEIISTTPNVSMPGLDILSGGPSGGFMQTLSLYNALTNRYTIDQVVVGTGTISLDGSIGKIGGLVQKVITAQRENTSYFILPRSQLSELEGLDFDIILIPVDNFDELLEVLDEIFI